jgi:fructokinase
MIDALWDRGPLADLPAEEIADVLAHAARAAAITVSRPGADPPYRSELGS